MDKKLVIKIFKLGKRSLNKTARIIVVGYNTSKPNGRYIEKLGSYGVFNHNDPIVTRPQLICSINLRRLGYWLNRGAILKSKVSWLVGMLSYYGKS